MKRYKNNTYNPSIKSYAIKPMSIVDYIAAQNYLHIGCRKIKFKDFERDKINAGCNLRIIYLRNSPTRYIRALSLEYMITKVNVCPFKERVRYIRMPIRFYKKRDVNNQ